MLGGEFIKEKAKDIAKELNITDQDTILFLEFRPLTKVLQNYLNGNRVQGMDSGHRLVRFHRFCPLYMMEGFC